MAVDVWKTSITDALKDPDWSGGWLGFTYYDPLSVSKMRQGEAQSLLTTKQAELLGQPQEQVTTIAPKTTTSTQTYIPPGEKPVLGEATTFKTPERPATPEFGTVEMEATPEFIAPAWDERAISALTQKRAAPGVRQLRSAVQASMAQSYDNPNVKRMSLRSALEGFGTGLESVMGAAGQTATAEYAMKYANEYKAAGMNWQAAVDAVKTKYAGQMTARSAEYQAEVDAVNQVYSAAVQAETQRVQQQTQRDLAVYNAAWDAYLKTGTTQQVATTIGGETKTVSGYSGSMPGSEGEGALSSIPTVSATYAKNFPNNYVQGTDGLWRSISKLRAAGLA